MKIVARQWRWIMILRVAIGFGVVAMGLQLPWLAVLLIGHPDDWNELRRMIPAGLAMASVGGYFAYCARMEWRPRGIAVGLFRGGLVCNVNYDVAQGYLSFSGQTLSVRFTSHPAGSDCAPGKSG